MYINLMRKIEYINPEQIFYEIEIVYYFIESLIYREI